MNCPNCNNEKTAVTLTRKPQRLRSCLACKFKFETTEMLDTELFVMRKNLEKAERIAAFNVTSQADVKSEVNRALGLHLAVLEQHALDAQDDTCRHALRATQSNLKEIVSREFLQ